MCYKEVDIEDMCKMSILLVKEKEKEAKIVKTVICLYRSSSFYTRSYRCVTAGYNLHSKCWC